MMADEIPDQNVIRIYRFPADGEWRARIGPDDGRGVEATGKSPCSALGFLIQQIHSGKYAFDPGWCPIDRENGGKTVSDALPEQVDPVQARLCRWPRPTANQAHHGSPA